MDLGEILTERPGFTKMVDDNIDGLRINFERTKYLLTQKVSDDNFNEAFQNFYEIVSVVPLLTNKIAIPQIVRARPNFGGEMFTEKTDVSYNWKNRHKIELGRFNRKGEPLFYASLPVEKSEVDYVMACALESCKELIDQHKAPPVQDLTISGWLIQEPFDIVNLCFDPKHLAKNPSLKESVDGYLNAISIHLTRKSAKFIKEFMHFYSDLSSQLCIDGSSYYVLSALFVAIRYYYKAKMGQRIYGLIYASAMTESEGLNIVMSRYAADNFLKLDKVVMYRYFLERFSKTYLAQPCSGMVKVTSDSFVIPNFIPKANSATHYF